MTLGNCRAYVCVDRAKKRDEAAGDISAQRLELPTICLAMKESEFGIFGSLLRLSQFGRVEESICAKA